MRCAMATQYLSYRSIISIPVFGNLSVLYSKHVKSERLMVLSIKAARPRLSHIGNNHIVFSDDIEQLAPVVCGKLLGKPLAKRIHEALQSGRHIRVVLDIVG